MPREASVAAGSPSSRPDTIATGRPAGLRAVTRSERGSGRNSERSLSLDLGRYSMLMEKLKVMTLLAVCALAFVGAWRGLRRMEARPPAPAALAGP